MQEALSLEGSALHGVVFDRSGRPQKRAGEARLPGSGRESPSCASSELNAAPFSPTMAPCMDRSGLESCRDC